jgi:hypothetical protein
VLLTEEKLCVHSLAAPHAMDGAMQLSLHPCMSQNTLTTKLKNCPHDWPVSLTRILLPFASSDAPATLCRAKEVGECSVVFVCACVSLPNSLWLVSDSGEEKGGWSYIYAFYYLFNFFHITTLPFNVCSCLYLRVSVLTGVWTSHDTCPWIFFSHALVMPDLFSKIRILVLLSKQTT